MQKENNPDWSAILAAGKTKPLGITLLTILHVIGSIAIVPVFLMLFSKKGEMAVGLEGLPFTTTDIFAGLLLVAVLTVGSALGMYLGRQWGWWLASYYYVHSAVQKTFAFVTTFQMANQLGASEAEIQTLAVKTFPRVIVKLLILFYLFRPQVWEYFEIAKIRKWVALGLLVGTYCTVSAIFAMIPYPFT